MKKIIIGVFAMVIILITIALNHENIYKVYKLNQIERDIVNSINGKFSNRIYDKTIKDYEKLQKSLEELNHYDITNMIEPYIKFVEEGVKIYIAKKSGIDEKYKDKWEYSNRKEDLEYGKDIEMEVFDYSDYVCYDMTDEDVENFHNGTFTNKLIEKLKTCLDYVEKDGKIEWQINDTEDKTIELPYNCYIKYKAYYVNMNVDFKKAKSADMSKYDLNKIDNHVMVKYLTKNNNKEEREVSIYGRDKQIYVWLKDILTNKGIHLNEAELKSHTCDRIKKEEGIREHQKWLEELTRRYSYDDPDIP